MGSGTRIFYRESPSEVVVLKDGREVATYRSKEELVETHIKGLLAIDQQDTRKVRELLRKYRPDPMTGGGR